MKDTKNDLSAKLSLVLAMAIFGTIGLIRKFIPLPSGCLAMARGLIGMGFLLALVKAKRQKINWQSIRKNIVVLLISGLFLGFNWILLFEAYNYTSVAVATLCYYMAPVMVILAAPVLFHEKLTLRRGLCVIAAVFGMVLVSGVPGAGAPGASGGRGVLLALASAVLYASIVLMNKTIRYVEAFDRTIVQLGTAGVTLIPYVLLAEDVSIAAAEPGKIALLAGLLLVVGIVHTGIPYALYYGSLGKLPAQTVAILSYIDPVVAVILSAVVLKEPTSLPVLLGAVLVLGSTILSELPEKTEHT